MSKHKFIALMLAIVMTISIVPGANIYASGNNGIVQEIDALINEYKTIVSTSPEAYAWVIKVDNFNKQHQENSKYRPLLELCNSASNDTYSVNSCNYSTKIIACLEYIKDKYNLTPISSIDDLIDEYNTLDKRSASAYYWVLKVNDLNEKYSSSSIYRTLLELCNSAFNDTYSINSCNYSTKIVANLITLKDEIEEQVTLSPIPTNLVTTTTIIENIETTLNIDNIIKEYNWYPVKCDEIINQYNTYMKNQREDYVVWFCAGVYYLNENFNTSSQYDRYIYKLIKEDCIKVIEYKYKQPNHLIFMPFDTTYTNLLQEIYDVFMAINDNKINDFKKIKANIWWDFSDLNNLNMLVCPPIDSSKLPSYVSEEERAALFAYYNEQDSMLNDTYDWEKANKLINEMLKKITITYDALLLPLEDIYDILKDDFSYEDVALVYEIVNVYDDLDRKVAEIWENLKKGQPLPSYITPILTPTPVTIISEEIEKIIITKKPNKTTYYENEEFDDTGMEVSAVYKRVYSDGSGYSISKKLPKADKTYKTNGWFSHRSGNDWIVFYIVDGQYDFASDSWKGNQEYMTTVDITILPVISTTPSPTPTLKPTNSITPTPTQKPTSTPKPTSKPSLPSSLSIGKQNEIAFNYAEDLIENMGYDYWSDLFEDEDVEDWDLDDWYDYLEDDYDETDIKILYWYYWTYYLEGEDDFAFEDEELEAPVITVKKKSSSKIQILYEEVDDNVKYQIQISTKKDFSKNVKQYNTSKTKVNISKLKKKTYYIRVRAYRDNEYSEWSVIKKIKMK